LFVHGSWTSSKIQFDLNMTMSRFEIAAESLCTMGMHEVKAGDSALECLLNGKVIIFSLWPHTPREQS
jgi:hypothetical protein